jgi:hypothetical protein
VNGDDLGDFLEYEGREGKVRWRPNRRKEARASGSSRGVNGGGVSVESGEGGGKRALVTENGPRWSPEEGGCSWGSRCHTGAKRGEEDLSAFCAEVTHAPGRRMEGRSGMGTPHGGERGGVWYRHGAQRGRGPVEQKPGRGGEATCGQPR